MLRGLHEQQLFSSSCCHLLSWSKPSREKLLISGCTGQDPLDILHPNRKPARIFPVFSEIAAKNWLSRNLRCHKNDASTLTVNNSYLLTDLKNISTDLSEIWHHGPPRACRGKNELIRFWSCHHHEPSKAGVAMAHIPPISVVL